MAGKKLFKRMGAANKAAAIIARRDTDADFAMGQDSMASIFGNLATTQRGQRRTMNRTNARIVGNMQRVAGQGARANRRQLARGSATAQNLFGAGLSKVVGQQLISGRAANRGSAVAGRGLVKAGKTLKRAGNDALGIQQAAAQEASGAADFMLAQAYRARNQEDAAAAAEAEQGLTQLKLEHQLNLAEMAQDAKYKESYLKMQFALENGGPAGQAGEAFTAASADLQDLLADGKLSPQQVANNTYSIAQQYGLGPEAAGRLVQMAQTHIGDGSPAAAFSKKYGQSPSSYLPADVSQRLNASVWNEAQPGTRASRSIALTLAGVTQDDKGFTMDGISYLEDQEVEAIVAFVDSTWNRIAAMKAQQQQGG